MTPLDLVLILDRHPRPVIGLVVFIVWASLNSAQALSVGPLASFRKSASWTQ